jgi:hypothetical protein
VPIALVCTAIQTTTEELFFRGYIVQGASLICSNRVFLAISFLEIAYKVFKRDEASELASQSDRKGRR